jgi:hypothetical protein
MPIRAISRRCGIAEPTLRYRIKAEQWERGPRAELASIEGTSQAAGRKKAAPSIEVAASVEAATNPATPKKTDASIEASVNPAAADPAAIADRGRDLVARMLAELEAITANHDELRAAIIDATKDDGDGRRRARLLRLVDLPSRAVVLKDLAAAARTLGEAQPAPAATGKKADAKGRAARVAATGRFATPPAPPKLIVNNETGRS